MLSNDDVPQLGGEVIPLSPLLAPYGHEPRVQAFRAQMAQAFPSIANRGLDQAITVSSI